MQSKVEVIYRSVKVMLVFCFLVVELQYNGKNVVRNWFMDIQQMIMVDDSKVNMQMKVRYLYMGCGS